jgi:hypothetical protein
MQLHPLFSKNKKHGQLELFKSHMSQHHIDQYLLNVKEYKKIQKKYLSLSSEFDGYESTTRS